MLPSLALAEPSRANALSDPKQPIEINADSLDVHQDQNTATFTGNVIAIQGDVNLRADKMVVHYANKAEKTGAKDAAKDAAFSGPTGDSIEKIDVDGNVVITQLDQTARGDSGVYDVPKQEIVLIGNVVLTKEKNVIKGQRAIYNLATGQSRMASGVQTGSANSGRVKALLIPKEKKAE